MVERFWVIKDEGGNVLNTFRGEVKQRYVGTDWNGTTVASVEQLPDEEELTTGIDDLKANLQQQINDLLARIEELDNP